MPVGAELFEELISAIEENAILAWIGQQQWDSSLKRRVQHYGYKYDYKARTVKAESYLGKLPDELLILAEKLPRFGFSEAPNQVIVNEYEPGQGIASHVDCVPCFGPVVASLSLGSGVEMQFTKLSNGKKKAIYLPPRSLLLIASEARFHWQHGIPARKSDMVNGVRSNRNYRVSLTFRTIKTD